MATTPVRMSGPALLSNAAATKYTTPAATKTIIRNLHLSNPTGSAVTFTMSIGADAAGTRLYDAYSIAAGAVLDVFLYLVLNAGDIVQALAGTNNVMTMTLDGEERTP